MLLDLGLQALNKLLIERLRLLGALQLGRDGLQLFLLASHNTSMFGTLLPHPTAIEIHII